MYPLHRSDIISSTKSMLNQQETEKLVRLASGESCCRKGAERAAK
jgi:hypothetical protein